MSVQENTSKGNVSELKIEASVDRLDEVLAFLEERLEAADCPPKAQMQIALAAEEVFVNVAQYAYAPGSGEVTVSIEISDDPPGAAIRFADRGVPFDPLEKEDPDISLSAEERQIGGLGIYMTKKFLDELCYAYRDGENVLTLKKRF